MGLDFSNIGPGLFALGKSLESIANIRNQRKTSKVLRDVFALNSLAQQKSREEDFAVLPPNPNDPFAGVDVPQGPTLRETIEGRFQSAVNELPAADVERVAPFLLRQREQILDRIDSEDRARQALQTVRQITSEDPDLQDIFRPLEELVGDDPGSHKGLIEYMLKTSMELRSAPFEATLKLRNQVNALTSPEGQQINDITQGRQLQVFEEKQEILEKFRKITREENEAIKKAENIFKGYKDVFDLSKRRYDDKISAYEKQLKKVREFEFEEETIALLEQNLDKSFRVQGGQFGKEQQSAEFTGDQIARAVFPFLRQSPTGQLRFEDVDRAVQALIISTQGDDNSFPVDPRSIEPVFEFLNELYGENLQESFRMQQALEERRNLKRIKQDALIAEERLIRSAQPLIQEGHEDPVTAETLQGIQFRFLDLNNSSVDVDESGNPQLELRWLPEHGGDAALISVAIGRDIFKVGSFEEPDNISPGAQLFKKSGKFTDSVGETLESIKSIPEALSEGAQDPEEEPAIAAQARKSVEQGRAQKAGGFTKIQSDFLKENRNEIVRAAEILVVDFNDDGRVIWTDASGKQHVVQPRDVDELIATFEDALTDHMNEMFGLPVRVDLDNPVLSEVRKSVLDAANRKSGGN